MAKKYSICVTCGLKVPYSDCAGASGPPADPQCAALQGWLTVSTWEGFEDIEHYDFCSFLCLQKWVDKHVPQIPGPFLKAFERDK